MKRKSLIGLIALVIGILGGTMVKSVFAQCPPSWSVITGSTIACPTDSFIQKTWQIVWQDGTQ